MQSTFNFDYNEFTNQIDNEAGLFKCGSKSNDEKRFEVLSPSAFSIISLDSAAGNGGHLSWSLASSTPISSGRRSLRVDNVCPNLIKIGPSSSSASRILSPLVSFLLGK